MKWIRIFVILLFLVVPCCAFQITEFCPDPYLSDDADEYIVLSGSGALNEVTISDGEGGFRFPLGTVATGKFVIARNAVAFKETHGQLPDFEWYDTSSVVPDVISGDKLRMANSRDELMLYNDGTLIQQVSWPADVRTREGQIHYLEEGIWDKRPLFIGQSRFIPATFNDVSVTAFVSPDSSEGVFASVLASAQRSIHVNVYEFTSTTIAEELIDAKNRGADVLVLVEGGPVGGISSEEKMVLYSLNQNEIPVYQMAEVNKIKAPYRFNHAKYAVIDAKGVLLTSENFKASGIPPIGFKGNRGWGVYVEDPELAAYFEDIFLSDVRMKNSIPIKGVAGPAELPPSITYVPEFPPQRFFGATVSPVISPDTSSQILELINSAQESIEIEQAYITNETATTLNPYLAAAIDASRRGVHVRVLLDSYWYNTEDEKDNDEMAALINRIAAGEGLPLEARCAELDLNNIEKIHNKGVIVDNRSVLVSSINWNSNSPNFNREAGVIIHHSGAAYYFREVFEDDWQPQAPRLDRGPEMLKYAGLALIVLLLIGLYLFRRRHL
ncbi:MAG: cardiolipin synthetase [Methanoregula sp. PtaU1.Bin051]|nr:MAG: cardiolipin synthetase [Methanoregula sp. PtaU1.Bin051]